MSLDQYGSDAAEETMQVSPSEPTAIGRIIEGEVAHSANGTAYPHTSAPAKLTKIEDGDVAYHRKVIAQAGQAQAILQSWMAHLGEKYQLPQGARIDEVGGIVYPTAPAPGRPPVD